MGIGKWLVKKMVQSNTRGLCRALSVNFNIAMNRHEKGEMPNVKSVSDFVVFAMQNRSGWEQVEDNIFEHTKTGERIAISQNNSLFDIVKEVAMIEIGYQIEDQPRSVKHELLYESHKVVERFFAGAVKN